MNNKKRSYNTMNNRTYNNNKRNRPHSSNYTQLSINKIYDSNGPDGKVRGTAQTIYEKYQSLARDASSSGDRILAENYLQHAEHYLRILHAIQEQMQNYYRTHQGSIESEDESQDSEDSDVDNKVNREQNENTEYRTPRHDRHQPRNYSQDSRGERSDRHDNNRYERSEKTERHDKEERGERGELQIPFLRRPQNKRTQRYNRVDNLEMSKSNTVEQTFNAPSETQEPSTSLEQPAKRRVVRRRVVSKNDEQQDVNE